MEYTIEQLEGVFDRLRWDDRKYEAYINKLKDNKELVGDREIIYIYPKNMFVEDKEIEFYTFLDKVIIITKDDESNKEYVSTSVLKIKDIEKLERVSGNEYEPAYLKIYFYNGEEIIFNNKLDTNEHHSYKFKNIINGIVTLLSERA